MQDRISFLKFFGSIAAGICTVIFWIFLAHAASVGTAVTVIVVPNAPSSLTASASSQSEIDLSWSDNANNENGFSIERSTGSDASFSVIATTSANVAIFADKGLSATTLYYYRVNAFNTNGTSTYSNEASTTTQSVPIPPPGNNNSGGGGGGGGGGGSGGSFSPTVFPTSAVFKGIAYPLSKVTLIENGQVVAVTQSGPDANFEVDLSGVTPGTYNFGVWAQDPAGNRSITQTFQVSLTNGATTVISGIFFPPTISADKIKVKQGGVVTIIGYTAPQTSVTVMVHSTNPIVKNITSTIAGIWTYALNTDLLALGDHTAVARAQAGNSATADSALINFTVGDEDVAAPKPNSAPTSGDINNDGKVNLVDFSVMAYWFGRPDPPAAVDANHDGVINLVDFSILAYYWTG